MTQQLRSSLRPWPFLICLLLLVPSLSTDLLAQVDIGLKWDSLGPEGGGVTTLTFVDDGSATVYAGTATSGLFHSSDGGATWHPLPASPTGWISAVAVDPSDARRLLLTLQTAPFGLWRSSNAGETWERIPFDPAPGVFFDVSFDPVDPRIVYAGSLRGLHRSADGGATWPRLLNPPEREVSELAVDPGDPDTLFTVLDNRLHRSTDGGESFRQVLMVPRGPLAGLLVDPTRPETVWIGGETIQRSTDGGETWSPVAGAPEADDLTVDSRDGTLFAGGRRDGQVGVFRSTDGVLWTLHAEGFDADHRPVRLALDRADSDHLLAGTPTGVFSSRDRGETWTDSGTGFDGQAVGAFAAPPRDPDLLLAVTGPDNTLLRSEDRGATWTPVASEPVEALETSPVEPSRVWAFTSSDEVPLVLSTDGGRTFEGAGREVLSSFGTSLADMEAHPTDPERFTVGIHRISSLIFSDLRSWQIWTTLDGGDTWEQIWDRPKLRLRALATETAPGAAEPTVLWVATTEGLFRLEPGGASVPWAEFPEIPEVEDLVFAGSTLFVVGESAILRTDPSRRTGTRIDGGLPEGRILDVTVDPIHSSLYVALEDAGVFRSSDRGATWQPVGPALPRLTGGLAVSRTQPQLVRAATANGVRELALVPTCVPDERTLCFQNGRFRVTVDWEDFQSGTGTGRSVPLEADTGAFWFFHPDNLELMVKILDGRTVNGNYWVFVGALSSVAYSLRIEDTSSGRVRHLANRAGQLASRARTGDFPAPLCSEVSCLDEPGPAAGTVASLARISTRHAAQTSGTCAADAETLCLRAGRFAVRVDWQDFAGGTGTGRPRPVTDDTGTFWFFRPENLELMVKVLDGRTVNGHFWVFLGALSNVPYTVEVTDTRTGAVWRHENPSPHLASVANTLAFPAEEELHP